MSGAVPQVPSPGENHLSPGKNHRNAKICSVCLSTPFDRLPAEEEAAYPHHASLQLLRASARSCPLCALLVEAIDEEERQLKNEPHQAGIALGDFAATLQDKYGFSEPVVGYIESIERFQGIQLCRGTNLLEVRDLSRYQSHTLGDVRLSEYGADFGSPIRQPPQPRSNSKSPTRPWLYGNWWLLNHPDGRLEPVRREDFFRPQLIGIGVRLTEKLTPHACKMYNRDVVHLRGSSVRVFTELGDPAAQHIPGRIRELFAGSSRAQEIIKFWIASCNRGHDCHQKEAPALPTRVLDLGTGLEIQSVRLWVTHGAKGRFLAISHAWGGKDIITTTKDTFDSHLAGIPLKNLPQTFRDAVEIAAGLGIRFVWIDSLCIIQKDFADWEREAPAMADVYRNAYLTVSASHALNATEGCFPRFRMFEYMPMESLSSGTMQRWDHLDLVPVQTSTSFRRRSKLFFHKGWMPPSTVAAPTVYCVGNYGRKFDPIAFEFLSSRAWTLQERLLSPRMLHFGRDQMYWECKCCFIAEDGSRFDPTTFSLDQVVNTNAADPATQTPTQFVSFVPEAQIPSSEDGRFGGGWLKVVADFSTRRLTVPDDKLPALSGLANLIASRTGDVYLCGLWKRHIYQDLCWRIDVSPVAGAESMVRDMRIEPDKDINTPGVKDLGIVLRDDSKPIERKRLAGRAPSWSWASMDAPVQFEPIQNDRVVAKLINHEVGLSGNDRFGRVSSGFIVLQAPLFLTERRDLRASDEWMRTTFDNNHTSETPVLIRKGNETAAGFATFDLDVAFPCHALFLDSAYALLLSTTGRQAGEYQRIGLAKFIRTKNQAHQTVVPGKIKALYSSHTQAQGPIGMDDPQSFVRIV